MTFIIATITVVSSVETNFRHTIFYLNYDLGSLTALVAMSNIHFLSFIISLQGISNYFDKFD